MGSLLTSAESLSTHGRPLWWGSLPISLTGTDESLVPSLHEIDASISRCFVLSSGPWHAWRTARHVFALRGHGSAPHCWSSDSNCTRTGHSRTGSPFLLRMPPRWYHQYCRNQYCFGMAQLVDSPAALCRRRREAGAYAIESREQTAWFKANAGWYSKTRPIAMITWRLAGVTKP